MRYPAATMKLLSITQCARPVLFENASREYPYSLAKHLHCHARNTSLPGVAAPSDETDNMLVYTTLDEADSGVPPCDEPP
jgi:hypothetical protein